MSISPSSLSLSLSHTSISPDWSGNSVQHSYCWCSPVFGEAVKLCQGDFRGLYSLQGQRGHMERRACPYHTGLAREREERVMYKEEERKEGDSVWVSVSLSAGAGFYKPLGRKWSGGHPLTCSHLPPLSLSQKQFKQLMEQGWSSFHLIRGHCDSYCSFLIRAPQA